MDLNFDKMYILTVFAMRINRSHPLIAKDTKWFLQLLPMYGIFSIMFALLINCIIHYDLKAKDFSSTCRNGCLCVLYFISTLSYYVMLVHQTTLKTIINTMNEDYAQALKFKADEQKVVLDYAKKGLYVCRQWLAMSIMGVGLFFVKNVLLYTYNYYVDDMKLVPLHDMTYPRIIEEKRDDIIVYASLYALTVYYGVFAAIMYMSFVPLGPVFMLHCCGQLELIVMRLENLFIKYTHEEANEKLKDIIRHLQNIYGFVKNIEKCFTGFYELTLKATTITLPIAVYEIIESCHRRELRMEFLVFIFGAMIISSSPCYYSHLLMEKGEQVRLAVYCSGWEVVQSRAARSTLMVILVRALQPIAIRTMFRTICLDALTDLLNQSYALFNLMNAMWA
ncbi:odorant receptor 23a [Manduca sexta]